ncbi:MAG: S46 family peptidase [bacterium]|nr:S46 family peptidase [bacterium]
MPRIPLRAALVALVLLTEAAALADEGMWTFDNPPTVQLQERYGFTVTPQWLQRLQLSCVRIGGGSGSFVSPDGLVLTNAHVAQGQQQKLSTAEHDYVEDGFLARTRAQELKCPDLEIVILQSYEDVTAQVLAALPTDASGLEAVAMREAASAAIAKSSQEATGLQSDIVMLYGGGEYWLYRYRSYTDVRLVFAPEAKAAYFGGDDDNFTYPRHDLDLALFRVYENGRPLASPAWLPLHPEGAGDGDLVFVPGHPGSTERLLTLAQLQVRRDHTFPRSEKFLDEAIAALREYAARGPEQSRQAGGLLNGLSNGRKSRQGEYRGLLDPAVWARKEAEEAEFRSRIAADAQLRERFGQAWPLIEQAEQARLSRLGELEGRTLPRFGLARTAQGLVRFVAEVQKPDGERLEGYHEAQLRRQRFRLLSPAPVYPELEQYLLELSLRRLATDLEPGDPFRSAVLADRDPAARAAELMAGTRLADPAVRQALLDGGPAAIAASTDPLIVMARELDPLLRNQEAWLREHVDGPARAGGELLGAARFAVYGKQAAPDATFTLRLSYGQVKGYPSNGTRAPAFTTFHGLVDRALSFRQQEPYDLSHRFGVRMRKLDLATPLNFVSTCDITGGNSGSPVVDREGRLVGLVFDGNIESLAGNFVYDETANRAVSVHAAAIALALRDIYDAGHLLQEMQRR